MDYFSKSPVRLLFPKIRENTSINAAPDDFLKQFYNQLDSK